MAVRGTPIRSSTPVTSSRALLRRTHFCVGRRHPYGLIERVVLGSESAQCDVHKAMQKRRKKSIMRCLSISNASRIELVLRVERRKRLRCEGEKSNEALIRARIAAAEGK